VKSPVHRSDLERFRTAIVQQIGLQFDNAKLGFLGEVLQRRLETLRRPTDAYLRDLEQQSSSVEIGALAQELTVGETYFFRNHEQFRALAEVVLPERMRVQRAPKALRLLSAGCASGEEAYSIAIVAREAIADASWDILIEAVDLNPAALEKAARGRYSSWALRDTSPEVQRKWFRADGRELVLDETVRAAVKFEAANLASADADIWRPAAYDAIFCRNVLMYFAPEQVRAVVARIAQSLAAGGFLFLGHAETLRSVSDQFHLRHTHETFYYERKENTGAIFRTPASITTKSDPGLTPILAFDDAWFDTIRRATERVAALVPAPIAEDRLAPPPTSPRWDPAPALDLLRRERFVEALDYVRDGLSEASSDPDVLLLEATLLSHSGQHAVAEARCLQLLLIDELNAGAHYVLALCREHAGDLDGAAEHDRVAAYLDPAFAMPRLHLGLLARRAGDRDAARRELAQALILLKGEDASRLLLFGGGFNRDALVTLCESSLGDDGGRP
jgi:chemotaxis protein methyltransferase CheR